MPDLGLVAVVVREYDEAIAFYVDAMGFRLVEDTDLGGGKRWVVVAPPGTGAAVLLAALYNPTWASAIVRPVDFVIAMSPSPC